MSFEQNNEEVEYEVHFRTVDTAYLNVYDIKLLAGRNFHHSDSITEFLVNETFAKEMGYQTPADAIGGVIGFGKDNLPIVGVVNDFHTQSFHHAIPPVALASNSGSSYSVAAKISSAQPISSTLDKLKGIWAEIYPDRDFNYYLLSESVEEMYKSEAQLIKLINTATGMAILISCLGLFGLTFFTVTQRAKEISVRKILGASVASIGRLIIKGFYKTGDRCTHISRSALILFHGKLAPGLSISY